MLHLPDVSRPRVSLGEDLGQGIVCFRRRDGGRMVADFMVDGRLAATAYLADDLSPRIDVAAVHGAGTIDAMILMQAINLANSRALQMAYAIHADRGSKKPI